MRPLLAAVRHQWTVVRRAPGEMAWVFLAPLYTVIFLAITDHAGRPDLAAYAVLGPAVMALVGTAVHTAGDLVDADRVEGRLDLLVAAPARFAVLVAGRTVAVIGLGAVTVVEAWLVAGLVFGTWVAVPHPGLFAATLALTVAATAGTATVMAGLFVLARSARTFQNSLSFPLFVLGGALVPVTVLPGWLQPVARLFYLSWATDLLRDATGAGPVSHAGARLAVVATLGAVAFGVGAVLLDRIVERVRVLGTLGHA